MGTLSNVPFLAGYNEQDALNRGQENAGIMKLSQLMSMAQANQGMQKGALEMSVMQDKLAREKKIRDALMAQQTGQGDTAVGGGQFGMPAQGSPAMGSPMSAGRAIAAKLHQTADIYEQNGDFDSAMKIREHAQKLMPELKDEQVRMGTEGKPVVVRNYKDGSTEVSPFNPVDKIEYQANGGQSLAKSGITGALIPDAAPLQHTQTPDSIASNQVTIRGQNMTDARARETLAQGKVSPGYRVTPSGAWEAIPGGPADQKSQQRAEGGDTVDSVIANLRTSYDTLDKAGGITNPDKGAMANLSASSSSSGLGQAMGRAFGTQNQSERNTILQQRPLLLQAIMKSTGMSAKQMDSNAELKLWLSTATDPTLDIAANKKALDLLEKNFGSRSPKNATLTAATPASNQVTTPDGQTQKPSLQDWMAKAKAANPSSSGAELEAYYFKKYGVK